MARARVERLHTYSRPTVGVEIPERFAAFELLPGEPQLLDELRERLPTLITDRKFGIISERLNGDSERVFFARDEMRELVGWCHFIRGSGPNTRINHTLRLQRDDVYLYDDGVDPRRRRRGVHTFMILRRMQIAHQEGCVRAVTEIADRNRPSIQSYRRLGFTPRSNVFFVRNLNRAVELPLRPSWMSRKKSGG